MKLLSRIGAFIFLIVTITACTPQKTTEELLKDETQRKEIMTMISEDPQMMAEMRDHMKGRKHAVMKIKSIVKDSGMMEKNLNMIMNRMEEDSVACMEMAELMMENKHMKSVILSSCQHEGMTLGKGMKSQNHTEMHR